MKKLWKWTHYYRRRLAFSLLRLAVRIFPPIYSAWGSPGEEGKNDSVGDRSYYLEIRGNIKP